MSASWEGARHFGGVAFIIDTRFTWTSLINIFRPIFSLWSIILIRSNDIIYA